MDMRILVRCITCVWNARRMLSPWRKTQGYELPIKENFDFWNRELDGINTDGFDDHMRRLSSTDRRVIRQRYESLRGRERYVGIYVSGHIDIRENIIKLSRHLGATEEEIALDILPSLNL